ncbi:PD-(D/E)XK nuclease-like domain-containing protein [Shewanella sp. MBTL60-007]|uniref:PD-(D/E)XK nuclease-like domain-containing protein n=1 Tax=Shewanella sp. MBTL60-007 TaxID=2815911 RepID=UPI001BB88D46|nr:PD-(D/E)XK nuclease-like domain-containing protein [Shewanella sp. MBTL60-007]GIU20771.1 hypothetical protein TUM3792_20740 [Shewanella sp. MBTL60-007]
MDIKSAFDGTRFTFQNNDSLIEGIYSGVPNHIYHQIPAINHSTIKPAFITLAHYFEEVNNKTKDKNTKPKSIGSLFHCMSLTPTNTYDDFFAYPEALYYPNDIHTTSQLNHALMLKGRSQSGNKQDLITALLEADPQAQIFDNRLKECLISNIGCDAFNAALELAGGKFASILSQLTKPELAKFHLKQAMSQSDWDLAETMATKFLSKAANCELLSNGYPELTLIAFDKHRNIWVKCKIDYLKTNLVPVDLKSTENASPSRFSYSAKEYFYDTQEAFYGYVASLLGLELLPMKFAAAESFAPYVSQIYTLPDVVRLDAKNLVQRTLNQIIDAERSGVITGYCANEMVLPFKRRANPRAASQPHSTESYF